MSLNYISNSFIYQSTKIPLSTNRSSSNPKSSSFSNTHHIHISSQNTPLCKICGCIFKKTHSNSPSFSISSFKPQHFNYTPEISKNEILTHLHNESKHQMIQYNTLHKEKDIHVYRKKMISKIHNFKEKYEMSDLSFYLGIFLMDILLLKEKANTFYEIEQIGTCTYFIAMKYTELNIMIPSIKQYQETFDNESIYSSEHLRKMEVNIMKQLNYKLNYISFYNALQFFLMNGIIFSNDIHNDINQTYIYSLVYKISYFIIENGICYLNYNQVYLACAIIALSRKVTELEKWLTIFEDVYHISENHFQKEFDFVNEIYFKRTQIVKVNTKKKITRNINHNTNNNLYKMKHKGFFYSNNSNVNKHNNRLLIKKLINNRKMISKSMEMTGDVITARNASANIKNKNIFNHHSHTNLRKTFSKDNNKERKCLSNNMKHYFRMDSANSNLQIKVCSSKKGNYHHYRSSSSAEKISHNIRKLEYHSNNNNNSYHIKSTYNSHSHSRAGNMNHNNSTNNIRHFHMTTGIKEQNHIMHNHNNITNNSNIKEHFSMNSSYCTATETFNGNNYNSNNVDKIFIRKTNSNRYHKNIQDYRSKITNSSKRLKNKTNSLNNIPFPLNASQSFHKKINNENKSNNEIITCKINNDKQNLSNKKDVLKREIDMIEEMTMHTLSRISNKAKHIVKKQTSFSKQKMSHLNGTNRGINEKQIRRIREIMSNKKKIKNNQM